MCLRSHLSNARTMQTLFHFTIASAASFTTVVVHSAPPVFYGNDRLESGEAILSKVNYGLDPPAICRIAPLQEPR